MITLQAYRRNLNSPQRESLWSPCKCKGDNWTASKTCHYDHPASVTICNSMSRLSTMTNTEGGFSILLNRMLQSCVSIEELRNHLIINSFIFSISCYKLFVCNWTINQSKLIKLEYRWNIRLMERGFWGWDICCVVLILWGWDLNTFEGDKIKLMFNSDLNILWTIKFDLD